ncbi:MAG: hypothetical protein FWB85_11370 [Chitinispirillia bacterium]|nr:hypothetical protein [Chitinispirillia bacterium]
MKKVLIAVVLCASMLTVGCAGVIWNSAFHETALPADATKMVEDAGAKEIGKYTTIFWGINLGYDTYSKLVSAEMRKGKRSYHVVVKNYLLFSETVGYIAVLE